MMFGFVTARQFFGIDINPFAVELAKVTMMIARKLAIDELHITEKALPLDNLDDNFTAADALIDELGNPVRWPPTDVIIGNPPFAGAKLLKPERGPDYVNAVRRAYPGVPGMADYCVYWFRKAHDHLRPCTADDPVAGRAGLVGTQNIRNNQSRVGGLDYVVQTGTIVEAVENQPWSGEANVHVSIANWVKTKDAMLSPSKRKLWFQADPAPGSMKLHARGRGPAEKAYELNYQECEFISSSLNNNTDVSGALPLKCNGSPQKFYQGITPGHAGFVLSPGARSDLLVEDPKSSEVVFPYLIGREIVSADGRPRRFVIDFGERSVIDAQQFPAAFNRVQSRVLASRIDKSEEGKDAQGKMRPHHKRFLDRWWQLSWSRSDMKEAIRGLRGRYLTGSRTQRWPFVFCFMDSEVLPGDKLQVFTFDDDYSFSILQSIAHLAWYRAKAARLKNEVDYNYSTESVFETFPWPQSVRHAQIEAVAEAGRTVRRVRGDALSKVRGGLRAVYNLLSLPGNNPLKEAHAALDAAVLTAYDFSPKKDLLAQLLALNLEVARREQAGEPVTAPGIPPGYPDPARLVTEDCIRAE